jgi:hypothetical protein
MVKIKEDMTGWKMCEHGFPNSRITIVKQADDYISPQGHHYACWWCQCTCGNPTLFTVKALELRNGDTQSCGCIKSEIHKKFNNFELNLKDNYGIYGVGYCSNTNAKFYFDMEDYPQIKDYCWYEVDCGEYHTIEAWDRKTKTQIKMHWLIVGKYYDHADRNALNNRKYNLRQATAAQNSANRNIGNRNSSGFIGVGWDKSRNKWLAYICVNNQKINLGRFSDKEDAIKTRLQAEAKYFKEFAPQRHLFEQYNILE